MSEPIPVDDWTTTPLRFEIRGDPGPLFAALAKAQGSFAPIVKNRTVRVEPLRGRAYTFDYATLDSVLAAVSPALAANELSLFQPFVAGDECELRTILAHSSGAYMQATTAFPWPTEVVRGADGKVIFREGEELRRRAGVQSLGSLLTYLRRYSVTSMLGVNAEEDDDGNSADGNTVQASSPRPEKAPPRRQEAPRPAKPQTPPPEPPAQPGPDAPEETAIVETTAEEVPEVIDDIDGPDGEPVDDAPMTEQTKKTLGALTGKLFGSNTRARGVLFRLATGAPIAKGTQWLEHDGQKMIDLLYDIAKHAGLNPDAPSLLPKEQESMVKALERRAGT